MADRTGIFYENSRDYYLNIYRLVVIVRNYDFDALLKKRFSAGKLAWLPRWCQRDWGFKTWPNSCPTGFVSLGGPFGSAIISKLCFLRFRAWTPPPLNELLFLFHSECSTNFYFWEILLICVIWKDMNNFEYITRGARRYYLKYKDYKWAFRSSLSFYFNKFKSHSIYFNTLSLIVKYIFDLQ